MMDETPIMEAEPEGDFQSVSQKMRDISQQFDSSQGSQTSSSIQENISSYVRYKEWLENVKQVQSGLINSSTEPATSEGESNDIEELTTRIAAHQEELIKETSNHAVKELVVRSAQLGYKLQQLLFPEDPEAESQEEEEKEKGEEQASSWAKKLCEKQRVLSSDILAHLNACQSLQDDVDQGKKDIRDIQAGNVELMKKLQSRESADKMNDTPSNSVQRQQEKLDDLISHITMEKGILQGLIIGSGVNWAKDPALKEVVIGLGQQLKLD
ncbi:centromere protein H [Strongylocentrotus purpuratus]|uniref:Centromere protein H C-terminal domain-containing protein n=1 Tax=Strongylocentrotus purpuratus TaxID=7668 RepID=A0A7M7TGK0_STRPU|nr:centromere protein H [Strongylocentrotus purpuratus]|eukprot:XP_786763.2 PREDICTED: centromere protein H [Strongylocentrotus purpuratus]